MKSSYLLAGTNLVLLIGITLPVKATVLYNASSEAVLTFLNAPDNTSISISPDNQIFIIEDDFGTTGDATATANLNNVKNLSSIQLGEFVEALSMVNGSAPPFSQSTAQSTIGVFFTNNSTEDVTFEFSFSYNLAAQRNIDDPLLDSVFANADFEANFGYGFIPGGPTVLPPPPVPISERVISGEPPMIVERLISFPVPAQTLGAVSFTATTNGSSNTVSETVPEPTSFLSFLALSTLGAVSTLKRKLSNTKMV